jgi:AcrR family transcriptional regulator
MAPVPRSTVQSYHHGDLRNAVVTAAVEQARAGGPQGVVLRELLRQVGVSHNAAYRHFADRDDLIRAVRDAAMERLGLAMARALDELPVFDDAVTGAVARLRSVGQSYVRFALAEPGLFRTAFFTGADESQGPAAADAALAETPNVAAALPYRILRTCVGEAVIAGAIPAERADAAEIGAWSAVHGIATLLLDSPLAPLRDDARERLIEQVLDMVTRGL